MLESGSSGSVRGASSNGRPYLEPRLVAGSFTYPCVRLLSTEAVRKHGEILQTIARNESFRDFFASKRSEG